MTINPHRITVALDRAKLFGPTADAKLGAVEPDLDNWEAGRSQPSGQQLARLAALANVPVEFFELADDQEPRLTFAFVRLRPRGVLVRREPHHPMRPARRPQGPTQRRPLVVHRRRHPRTPGQPERSMSALADQLATYLATRQHTLSTARLTGMDQLFAEAEYVVKEALELRDAVIELAEADRRGEATEEHWRHVRHEIADVTLADTTMASLMPGGVTVEACIAEKTEADRGRG